MGIEIAAIGSAVMGAASTAASWAATAAPYISAASTVASAVTGYSQQRAADKAQNTYNRQADELARKQAQIESDLILDDADYNANAEMKDAARLARIERQDAELEAQLIREDAYRTASSQKTSYLKSGVILAGSPLIVMQETFKKADENADRVLGRAYDNAAYREEVAKENAKNIRSRAARQSESVLTAGSITTPTVSRASLLGSISEAAGGLMNTYTNYQLMKKQTG